METLCFKWSISLHLISKIIKYVAKVDIPREYLFYYKTECRSLFVCCSVCLSMFDKISVYIKEGTVDDFHWVVLRTPRRSDGEINMF